MMSYILKNHKMNMILIVLCLLFTSTLLAQFPEGFEGGAIPSTWTVYNVDGDTKQFTAKNNGANSYEGSWTADVGWNVNGNDDWLVTPQINVTSNQKVLKFYARSTSTTYYEDFNIKLSTTGNAVANFTVNVASYTSIPNEWTEYVVDLNSYVGQSVYLAVQCVSYNQLTFRVDGFDWVLGNDMSAISITGPSAPTANTATNYVVTVKNNGGNAQTNYTVKFYVNDNEVATQTGTNIAPAATAPFTFSWTPATAQNYTLKGKVILANDANPANDTTPPLNVTVQPEGTATAYIGDPNTTTTGYTYPINFYYKSSLSQTIYLANEINIGGAITSIKYFMNSYGDIPANKPLKVWMANTTDASFSTATSWMPLSQFQLVFDGTVTIPSGQVELTIPLQTPFAYSGNNLVIMVQRPLDSSYYSSLNKFQYTAITGGGNRTLYYNNDTTEVDPAAPASGYAASNIANISISISTAGLATLTGTVSSAGTPLANATVSIDGTTRSTQTNAQGVYQMPYLTPGTVSLTATRNGYNDTHVDGVVLTANQTTTQNINMTTMSNITVSGQVVNSVTGTAVQGALITLDGYEHYETYTNAAGAFTIPQVFSGQTYALKAVKQAYAIYTQQVVVGTTDLTIPAIALVQGPSTIEAYVGNPASTTTTYSYPINFFYKSSLSQTIYYADELSSEYYLGSDAAITTLKYFMTLAGNIPANKPIKVWMANTDITEFATTTSWLPASAFTLVWDGTVNLSTSGAYELNFQLNTPFVYTGNNLVVMIQRPLDDAYYSTTNKFNTTSTTNHPNRVLYRQSDSIQQEPTDTAATGTRASIVPNAQFSFATAGFAALNGVVSGANGPIVGANVNVVGTSRNAITNTQGQYQLEYLDPGTVTLKTTCLGYNDQYTEGVVLVVDQTTTQNINMTTMSSITVSGQVVNSVTGTAVEGVLITLDGYDHYETYTNAAGAFTIPQVFSEQTYTLKALKQAYVVYTQQVVVGTSDLTIPTISLVQGPSTIEAYVGNPASTTTTYSYPINFFYKSSLSQSFYYADELSSDYYLGGGAAISSIKYFMTLAGNIPANKPLKVWMANTDETAFGSTTAWLPASAFTLVWDSTVDLSATGAHELVFEFDTPFIYNGGNLVVMIQRPLDDAYYSTSNLFKTTDTPNHPNRTLYRQNDTTQQEPTDTAATGTRVNFATNIQFNIVTSGFATLNGVVTDVNGPVADARVAVVGTNRFAITNAQGQYQMNYIPAGTVTLKTTCQGYNDQYTEGVVLTADQNTVQNITMTPMTQISVTGFVKNATTQAGIPAAEIRLIGYENYSVVTSSTGSFTFPSIYSGQTYQLKVLKPGYQFYTMDLTVGTTNMTVPDILVNQSPATVEAYVGNPNSTTSINSYPINLYWKNSYTQALYMQDEISSEYYLGGGSPIYSIKYYANLYGGAPSASPIKIWIGNTSLSSFTNTSSWVNVNDMTLVFDGTLDFSQAGQQEFEIVLDEPFPYEGENLVIAVLRPLDGDYYSSSNKWYYTATPQYNNRLLYYNSDSTEANPASPPVGNLASNVPNTLFSINTSGFATLVGNTTANNAPLAGVKVAIDGTNRFAMSDAQGNYALNYAPAGQNSITASKHGYYNSTVQLNLEVDEITTHNFNLTQLPNVTVTGVVHGSDTGAGLSNATVSLSGYDNYQTTTNANGQFTIPGVYAAQTYTIGIVRAGYQNYTGQAVVGDTNTNLGTLVMSEIAYPVTNVYAEIANNTIILTWNAPQIPNGVADDSRREGATNKLSSASSHKIIISKNAFTGNALTVNKDDVTTTQLGVIGNNTNFKEKTNYTRSLTGYTIWRTPIAGVDNQDFWTSIQNNYDGLSYTDQSWGQTPSGEYKYVVSATYTSNVLSEPAFSNTVAKDMMASVTFNLSTADGQTPAGAVVTLVNSDGNPDHAYSTTATGNVVVIPNVWLGVYNLTVTKTGYMPYTHNNLVINQVEYTYPTVINLQISNIFFQEGFEGTAFPPTGWTLNDADGDGRNWYIGDGAQIPAHSGDKCVTSASYDNNTGALTPDNYLITPMINLATNATSYNIKYWVAPQDPAYYNEHYSLLISTTGTNIADFTTLISETLTNTAWVQRTYPLDSYIGQNVYIAFRHHNSTDIYMIKIDDIEIDRTLASDEEVIVPVITQTALKGNYPNPFNPETSIAFDLANDGNVCIDIFNIKGQKVKALVNDRFSSGTHSVVWNGKDDNGKNVGSGIYFYNMKSGKYTSTRKMILMK